MTLFDTATHALPESIAALDFGYLGRKLLDDDAFEAKRRMASGCGMDSG